MKIFNKTLAKRCFLVCFTFISLYFAIASSNILSYWVFPRSCRGLEDRDALITMLVFLISSLMTADGIKRLMRQNFRGPGLGFIIALISFNGSIFAIEYGSLAINWMEYFVQGF